MKSFKILGREVFSWGENESRIHNKVYSGSMMANRDYAKPLNLSQMRINVLREPLLYKAIRKKNLDTVRNWFDVVTLKSGGKVPVAVDKIIHDFEERTNFKKVLDEAGVSADIYGTGFIERTFEGERAPEQDSKPNRSRKPLGLIVQNSENVGECKQKEKSEDRTWYWVYKDPKSVSQEILIHPDRLQPIIHDKLPFSRFGISKANVLRNIMNSKMDADVSSGEILNWFGSGLYDLTIHGMQPEQEKNAEQKLKAHPDYIIHDEEYELDVKNPTRIDPEPFYNYFYVNTAAVMVMPAHMLTGVQIGEVTGSETGFSDYVHDVENIQNVVYSPIITKIYKQLLESYGYKWKYAIKWRPIFIDELSEAKILQTRSFSAVQNYNAGLVSGKEARIMLNDGTVELDPDSVPKKPKVDVPKPSGTEPNVEPQPVVKPKQDKPKMRFITPEQEQFLITKMRMDGMREIEDQEKRLKEAENIKKNKKIGEK